MSEPSRDELHDWANSVTSAMAKYCGGFSVHEFWSVRSLVYEVRRKVLAGDYTHFESDAARAKRCTKTQDMFT